MWIFFLFPVMCPDNMEIPVNYEKCILYYLSGTGNTFRVASWIENKLTDTGTEVVLVPIEAADFEDELAGSENARLLVGFLMPVHGFTLPWLMLKRLLEVPKNINADVFISSTRGGLKFKRLFTPGISGSAMFVAALILALKGFSVKWIKSFDMPSNWMSLHSGLKEKNARAIIERTESRVTPFAEKIIEGKKHLFHVNSISELLWGLVLLPVSIPYMFMGRFGLAKLFFSGHTCNGCGLCARSCPVGAIEMRGIPNGRPFWTMKCESCMRCMAYCPLEAVEVHQPTLAAYYYASILPAVYAAEKTVSLLPDSSGLVYQGVYTAASIGFYFLSLVLVYNGLYLLSRIRFFNRLLCYTTLTHVYRRYHEPDTDARDMQ